jgi:hypothetical protein
VANSVPQSGTVSTTSAALAFWGIVSNPNPAGPTDSYLTGVTCLGVGDCWAVGYYNKKTTDDTQTLIEQETGSGWRIVSSPNPQNSWNAALSGVTCVSASDCWAVGGYSSDGDMPANQTLIEHDTGRGWSIVVSPTPSASAESGLTSVSCISASDCWAVGYSTTDVLTNAQTLVEQDAGSGWNVVPSPSRSAGWSALTGLACVSASDCWAVGHNEDASGHYQTLIEQNAGSGWSIVSNPSPSASTDSELSDVTCVSLSDCWVVGYSGDASNSIQTLTEQNTGSGWSIVPSPTPPSYWSELDSVTCVSATDCWAVGYSAPADLSSRSLIEQDAGAGWSIVASPNPSSSVMSGLDGVTCVSASECSAVGYSTTFSGRETLIEQIHP